MYKAVFIDLDGTLLKSDHTISPATIAVIQKLKERNILVVLVSARPLHGIVEISKTIGLTDAPIASLNGSYITLGGEVLFESFIDLPTTVQLNEILHKHEVTLVYYQQMQWFCDEENAYTIHEQKITETKLIIQPFHETVEYWETHDAGPDKILIIAEVPVVEEVQDMLKSMFAETLNIATSKPIYLELMSKQSSKTGAVKFMMEKFGIEREEVIALGDNYNDKDMLAFAGTGVAMGNAPDEVKAVADYVTDTNNNDGVAKALIKFLEL